MSLIELASWKATRPSSPKREGFIKLQTEVAERNRNAFRRSNGNDSYGKSTLSRRHGAELASMLMRMYAE
jgi:hypothetical protein